MSRSLAETIAWGYGLKTEKIDGRGIVVTHADDGEYLEVKGVEFRKGKSVFTAELSAEGNGSIEIHIDAPDGYLAGTLAIKPTEGKYQTFSTKVNPLAGNHDLYFVFRGDSRLKWDWWRLR